MEYVAYAVMVLVLGLIAYAAYRARQQKISDANRGYPVSGKPNRDTDLR